MSRVLRFVALALCCMWLSLSGCASSTAAHTPPVAAPTRPAAAASPTMAPDAAFRQELGGVPNLRGSFIGGAGGEIETLAAVTIVHVNVQLASPSLTDAQWDAFTIQHALWQPS